MMKWDSLPEATHIVLKTLSSEASLSKFILIGGTAIALQLGHRISEDIDFISHSDTLNQHEIDDVLNAINGDISKVPHDIMSVVDFEDHGLDIDEFHQNYSINITSGTVKISFAAPDVNKPIIMRETPLQEGFLSYASLKQLWSLKVIALTLRHKKRDLFDLKTLIEQKVGSVGMLLEELVALKGRNYAFISEAKLTSWPPQDFLTISFKDKRVSDERIGNTVSAFFIKHLSAMKKERLTENKDVDLDSSLMPR
jgi:predicted nucleotidyltransferase component of viral defense system